MPAATKHRDLIEKLHDRAVRQLVAAHRQRKDQPLVLAVRYRLDDRAGNVHLFEVLDQFPGGDEDELFVTEFGPSPNLIIVGKLELVLGSPGQVRTALRRRDPIMKVVRRGQVVFASRSAKAARLREELGL